VLTRVAVGLTKGMKCDIIYISLKVEDMFPIEDEPELDLDEVCIDGGKHDWMFTPHGYGDNVTFDYTCRKCGKEDNEKPYKEK